MASVLYPVNTPISTTVVAEISPTRKPSSCPCSGATAILCSNT